MSGKRSEHRETWRQRVAEQEQSGLSVRGYCEQHGMAEHSFYFWRRRMREDRPVSFALVAAKPVNNETQAIELVLAEGDRLRIPCEEAALRTVLRVLRAGA